MSGLAQLVADELSGEVDPRVAAFAAHIAARWDGHAEAVLFYGSCLWSAPADLSGQMLDFYLVVDRYDRAYRSRLAAAANALVPPNVYHATHAGLRAKYAVLSADDLARECGPRARSVSVWARFAQPARLAWVSGDDARARTVAAVARAAPTLIEAARPMLPDSVDAEALWTHAFALTYDAELRAEGRARPEAIVRADPARYATFLPPALARAGLPARITGGAVHFAEPADRAEGERLWAARRRAGKRLSKLRLAKAAFTFDGGIDYLAWKIERHSGVPVAIAPWMRRLPLLAGLLLLPRLRRAGAIR